MECGEVWWGEVVLVGWLVDWLIGGCVGGGGRVGGWVTVEAQPPRTTLH